MLLPTQIIEPNPQFATDWSKKSLYKKVQQNSWRQYHKHHANLLDRRQWCCCTATIHLNPIHLKTQQGKTAKSETNKQTSEKKLRWSNFWSTASNS